MLFLLLNSRLQRALLLAIGLSGAALGFAAEPNKKSSTTPMNRVVRPAGNLPATSGIGAAAHAESPGLRVTPGVDGPRPAGPQPEPPLEDLKGKLGGVKVPLRDPFIPGGKPARPSAAGRVVIPADVLRNDRLLDDALRDRQPDLRGKITGRVHLRATVPLERLVIDAVNGARRVSVRPTVDPRDEFTVRYELRDLPAGTYTLTPGVTGGGVRGEVWTPASRRVTLRAAEVKNGGDFTYAVPRETHRIRATLIAAAIQGQFAGTELRLNNYGRRHGDSWNLANSSYLVLPRALGGGRIDFSLAPVSINLDADPSNPLSPDLGQAKYYVNDLNLSRLTVRHDDDAIRLRLFFEEDGTELKGFHTGALASAGDDGAPDIQVNDMSIDVRLVPTVESNRLTFVRPVPVTFAANVRAGGVCRVAGIDICDELFDYRDRIKSEVEANVGGLLNDAGIQSRIDAAVESTLRGLGIGPRFVSATIDGEDLVLEAFEE